MVVVPKFVGAVEGVQFLNRQPREISVAKRRRQVRSTTAEVRHPDLDGFVFVEESFVDERTQTGPGGIEHGPVPGGAVVVGARDDHHESSTGAHLGSAGDKEIPPVSLGLVGVCRSCVPVGAVADLDVIRYR